MDNEIIIPEITPPDYSSDLSEAQPHLPDMLEPQTSANDWVAKVVRRIIRGRVDGN